MKVYDERKKLISKLGDLTTGEAFYFRYLLFLKTCAIKDTSGNDCIVCVGLEDGRVEYFSELLDVVPVEAKVVLP